MSGVTFEDRVEWRVITGICMGHKSDVVCRMIWVVRVT